MKREFLLRHPGEAADLVARMKADEIGPALGDQRADALVEMMERLEHYQVERVFARLSVAEQDNLLGRCSNRLALFILEDMTGRAKRRIFDRLERGLADDLRRLLTFPEDTAGHFMERTGEICRPGMLVEEVLERLRHSESRRARSLYVVDDDQRVIGRVEMQDLALAVRSATIAGLMLPVEGVVSLTSPREELMERFEENRLDSIPVLDADQRLVGVVRHANLFDVAEEEWSADIQRMVGASADEKALSSPLFAVRKRLPWLHINLLTAFLAASVVGLFEGVIAQFTALAILLPVVAGQSGNAGSQALSVTMRGLALKEVGVRQWRRVLSKEVLVGIYDGLALAVTCGLGVLVWSRSLGLALVIAIAMIISMVAAGMSGALVPMFLARIGQDPATASSIILTTVTDVAGFFSFLGTATLLSFLL